MKRDEEESTKKARSLIALSVLLIFIAVTVIVFIRVGKPLIELVADPPRFKAYLEGYGALSKGVFAGIMALQVIVAVIPAGPFQVAGGYAFGAFTGTVLCLIGNGVGAMLAYFTARIFGRRAVALFIPPQQIEKLMHILDKPRWKILFVVIFMIPGSPKDVLTYLAGLSALGPLAVLILSSLGRLPAILASALGGAAISEESYVSAAIVFGILAVVSIAGAVIYKKLSRNNASSGDEKNDTRSMDEKT